jgi:hypothetical protein
MNERHPFSLLAPQRRNSRVHANTSGAARLRVHSLGASSDTHTAFKVHIGWHSHVQLKREGNSWQSRRARKESSRSVASSERLDLLAAR